MKFKYLFIIPCFICLQSCFVKERSIYNKETKNFATVTKVNLPLFLIQPFIKKALKENDDSEALLPLIKKISKIKVYVVEDGNAEIVHTLDKKFNPKNYEEWLVVKQAKQNVSLNVQQKNNIIHKMLLHVKTNEELVLVEIAGHYTIKDLSDCINQIIKDDYKKLVWNK